MPTNRTASGIRGSSETLDPDMRHSLCYAIGTHLLVARPCVKHVSRMSRQHLGSSGQYAQVIDTDLSSWTMWHWPAQEAVSHVSAHVGDGRSGPESVVHIDRDEAVATFELLELLGRLSHVLLALSPESLGLGDQFVQRAEVRAV